MSVVDWWMSTGNKLASNLTDLSAAAGPYNSEKPNVISGERTVNPNEAIVGLNAHVKKTNIVNRLQDVCRYGYFD